MVARVNFNQVVYDEQPQNVVEVGVGWCVLGVEERQERDVPTVFGDGFGATAV